MADVDVVLRCFEDGWHYRCDRPLRNEMKVVESVEDSFQSNDELRSKQANASGTEAAGSLGEESTAENSAVVPGDRSMDSGKEDEDHIIRTKSEMKRVFDTYDANGDGHICQGELGSFMKKLDVDVSEEELASMMKSVDVNNDGRVDFEEFLKLHTALVEKDQTEPGNHHDEEAELRDAFEVFDKNNDGFISVIELQSVLRSLGINTGVKIQDVKKMIAVVDKNNDGQVDFTEFKQLMNSLPSETS